MRFLTIICITLLSIPVKGQDLKILKAFKSNEQKAQFYYDILDFERAAIFYERIYLDNPTRTDYAIITAECYRQLNNYQEAEKWYNLGIIDGTHDVPLYLLHYAQTLTANGKYEEATLWFEKYNKLVPTDLRAIKRLATLQNLHFHFKDSAAIEMEYLNINTDFDEFAPAFYHGGIAFLSNRATTQKFKNVMNWGDENNFDLFYSQEREDGLMESPVKFHHSVNSSLHEGPLEFIEGEGEDRIIFTQSDLKSRNETHLALYEAKVDVSNHEFSNIVPLNINDPSFSNAHPTISPNGQTLIFSSNRPGGYGATDLYITHRKDKQWSTPENLGSIINSEGSEYFPFLMNDEELVFASNGHGGIGGMDLFIVDLTKTPYELENMGYPYNSNKDDYAFISNATGTQGFFSSNRKSGLDDDMYRFRVIWTAYELTVTEQNTLNPLSDVEVKLVRRNNDLETVYTNKEGYVDLLAVPGEQLIIELSKEGYIENSMVILPSTSSIGSITPVRMELEKEKAIDSEHLKENEVIEYNWKKYFRQEKLVVQVDGKIYEYRELGNQMFLVSGDEKIKLEGAVDANLDIKKRAEMAILASNLVIEKTFDITTVYFDHDVHEVKGAEQEVLNDIAALLKANPHVKVEVQGYTDSRGSMSYNDILSFNRAQQVSRYLMENGVEGAQLIINNYGEQGLVNDCDDDKECTDLQHEVNRRVEFKIFIYPEDSEL